MLIISLNAEKKKLLFLSFLHQIIPQIDLCMAFASYYEEFKVNSVLRDKPINTEELLLLELNYFTGQVKSNLHHQYHYHHHHIIFTHDVHYQLLLNDKGNENL